MYQRNQKNSGNWRIRLELQKERVSRKCFAFLQKCDNSEWTPEDTVPIALGSLFLLNLFIIFN
jgi:hypothetical protein